MSDTGGDDPIYRGDTPQDGVPWDSPGSPPPSPTGPAYTSHYPTGPHGPVVPPTPKKRWPWVLGLSLLFCGLPLGGCVALLGIGAFSLNQTADEISETVDDFFAAAAANELDQNRQFFDDDPPCISQNAAIEEMSSYSWSEWDVQRVSFTERTDNSTTSWNADPESNMLDGRPNESVGRTIGVVDTEEGIVEFTIYLSKPVGTWRICTIELR